MELIITYLLEKGGIFGVLFAITLFWIFLREKQLFSKSTPKKEDEKINKDSEKIIYILEDIKNTQDKILEQYGSANSLMEKIQGFEKAELAGIEKLSTQLSNIDNKTSDVDKKIKDLWDWHSVKDAEGVPIWYVRRSLEESIDKLGNSVNLLQSNLTQIGETLRVDLEDRLQKVNDERIIELKNILDTYNKTLTDLILALEKIKFLLKNKKDEE